MRVHQRKPAPVTLASEWEKYKKLVYPKGIPPDQNEECQNAFVAGAYLVLSVMASDMSEAETLVTSIAWTEEARQYVKAICGRSIERN